MTLSHIVLTLLTSGVLAGSTCENLHRLQLPNAKITLAQTVAASASLPSYCRVAITSQPTDDSDIKIEVWMPVFGWDHNFEGNGNGGWSGSIVPRALARGLANGTATAMTDTGHAGGSGSFALGHPEKLIDFGYRAVHEMTVAAKAVLKAYYGEDPAHSYWNGCSAGGKQGLKEAQRFAEDYDGILAGSPAANWIGRATQAIWAAQAMHNDEGSYIPPEKYAFIHDAVLQACDALDGVRDGVLEDPRQCKFDPGILECKEGGNSACLTPKQVEAARKIYAPSMNPRTKQALYSGLEPGSELGWATWGGPKPLSIGLDHFRYVVFKDPKWDYRTLNFDSDIALALKIDDGSLNAIDPNLKTFFARGGKLLQYHGWSDPQISPGNSVAYYKSVLEAMGGVKKVAGSYRLFMVPGMAHCGGGEGPNTFDAMTALKLWVEKGKAPEKIVAAGTQQGSLRTRPLCPYPQVAKYNGSGSTDDAANFTCRAP